MPDITKHGRKRLKERTGSPKSAKIKVVQRAWEKGLKHSELNGKLHKYIDYLCLSHGGKNIRLYNYMVYIFGGDSLITVFNLPNEHKKRYENAMRKKKESVYE